MRGRKATGGKALPMASSGRNPVGTVYKGRAPAPSPEPAAPAPRVTRSRKKALPTVLEEPIPVGAPSTVLVSRQEDAEDLEFLILSDDENRKQPSPTTGRVTLPNPAVSGCSATPIAIQGSHPPQPRLQLARATSGARSNRKASVMAPADPTEPADPIEPLPIVNKGKGRATPIRNDIKTYYLDDGDDSAYLSDNPKDKDFDIQSREDSILDPDLGLDDDSEPSDVDSERTLPVSVQKPPQAAGRKPGRPPKVAPVLPPFPIKLMTKVNGAVRMFDLNSESTLADVRDKVAEFHKKRHFQLELYYITIWSGKTDKVELNQEADWEFLVEFARANSNKKKAALYQVEIFDGIESKETKKPQKGKQSNQSRADGEEGENDNSRSGIMGRISVRHGCNDCGFECYVVKDRKYMSYGITVGSHHRIHRPILVRWANAVMATKDSDANISEDFLPDHLIEDVLQIKKPNNDISDGPFSAPPPRQRGMSGSQPMQQPVQQGAPSNMWPSAPYSPFFFPPMPSPYKRFMEQMSSERPPSPTRHGDTVGSEGARIGDWLEELDQQLDSDDEAYSPLLPQLKQIGVRRVNDLTLFTPEDIEGRTGCNIGAAKRLVAKAKLAMHKK